jgi:DinB family protein
MPNKTLTVEQVVALLEATPPRIAELTSGLKSTQLHRPSDGEWSANDVLAHLRACADVWGGCMISIIEGAPALRAVNPLTWIEKTDYRSQDFARSLRSFARQRVELLDALRPTPRADWLRTVTVTGAGAPLKRDALFYGRWMAGHERAHLKQIAKMVSGLERER